MSWSELHGALTHIPVAFLLAVPLFELGALWLRKPIWREVSFWLLVGAVLLAVPSLAVGWITANDLHLTGTAAAVPVVVFRHRLAAFTTTALATALLLWRVRTRDAIAGNARWGAIALATVAALTVGYTGYLGGRMVFGADDPAAAATAPAKPAPTNSGAAQKALADPKQAAAGQKLFASLPCQSCHRISGKGGISGPDLTHEARRHADPKWHVAHLKDPSKFKPDSDMPAFDSLPAGQLQALAAFLASRK